MKKIALALVASLIAFSAMAQEHLTFKSIPINGTIYQFSAKLKNDGFSDLRKDNDGRWYVGQFTGKKCQIMVKYTAVTETVYAVYVLFDDRTEWSMAKSDYFALKAALTKKYGEPQSIEEFDKYYKEDGYEFMHMKDGHVTWESRYMTDLGRIYLYIRDQGVSRGCAIIQYLDAANSEKATNELTNDL